MPRTMFSGQLSVAVTVMATTCLVPSWCHAQCWTFGVETLEPRSHAGVVLGADNKLYVIGGHNAGGAIAKVERFDEGNGTWEYVAPLPVPTGATAAARDNSGRIYVVGGSQDGVGPVATVLRYDYDNDSWTPPGDVASMATARKSHSVVSDSQGRIYALGGIDLVDGSETYLTSVERYDPVANSWETLADMDLRRAYVGVGVDSSDQVYVIGGNPDPGATDTVERYNPTSNTWEYVTPMPGGPRATQSAQALDGRIYVAGGWQPLYTDRVEIYDPETDTWSEFCSMNRATNNFDMVTSSTGIIYAIGGDFGVTTVEQVDPGKQAIPTVSEWGLIGMAVLLVVAGAVVFRAPRKATG